MIRQSLKAVCAFVALSIVVLAPSLSRAASVSVNFNSNNFPVGAGVSAGAVPAVNWNNVPAGAISNQVLVNDTGANSGLTLSVLNHPVTDGLGTSFAGAGDNAMMHGHIYEGSNVPVDVSFTGTIPYPKYDIYMYFNSSVVTNQLNFSILNSSLGSLGLNKTGFETPGSDSSFIESNATTNGNYVRFSNLTSANVPTNFVIRSVGSGLSPSDQYGYFNGMQIVGVPEPSSMVLAAMGGLALAWCARFRRRS